MLYGRSTEQAELEGLLAAVDSGRSAALVLRGEAGIGKTALLDWLARTAPRRGLRLLRVRGVEPEADLAFGGLVQLLWPVQDRLAALPGAQADTLRAVLGAGRLSGQDRFLTGLAVLTLLAELADEEPLLCLVDDAQWLDRATAEALLFAARRLSAERVAMVFATREEGFTAQGLTELRPSRLDPRDAARLLADRGLAPALREQVIAESAGNPLALIEFAAAQRQHPDRAMPLPVADRVLTSFRAQIGRLPERTRLMMLIAAAEGRGDLPMLLKAAQSMNVGLEDLEEAERERLVLVTESSVAFRHPLIASAAYQGAVLARRIAVHRALAEAATDPDCRARHLAAATTAPDPGIAAELAAAAERARHRSAYAAAAGLYRHAARLTTDRASRAGWLGEAAGLALAAGQAGPAGELAEQAEACADEPAALADLAPIRAAVVFETGDQRRAARLLIERAAGADPERAAALLRTGATYAWSCGDRSAVRSAARHLAAVGRPDLLVRGMARLADGDHTGGLPLVAEFLERHRVADREADDEAERMRVLHSAVILGDDTAVLALAAAEVERRRKHGLIGALPQVLHILARTQVLAGLHRDAEASAAEAAEIARDTGPHRRTDWFGDVPARVAAVEGDAERCRRLAREAPEADRAAADGVLALLELGTGDHEAALRRLETSGESGAGSGEYPALLVASAADQVEAAARLGSRDRAEEPLRRFETWAAAGRRPWARAVALRCRALTEEAVGGAAGEAAGDAEEHYAEALRLHARDGRPFERARTQLLYGEWLRRSRRRTDARAPLRSALETFERLRAAPWAERTRTELRATGEPGTAARTAAANLIDRLTPQELQVVRLAARGSSSREIAAQLFLSPRTVEHHLYKAYPKLGVGSRRELVRLELD
ncbi:helix-turn-helix transcriptional regulator [Streptomyces carminius]|uniref:Helix-turn-helix transcriptional regulator n=1 Tax=Streptomyces carminius TaxID=2665496 RepID=A0A2M8LU41_9ACTN|nr:LuxR family transcriptional regulator [Streptomyces carminius]PJE95471.1 helix-turn-helix transcriptional regulator [Streptomyces carminius]